MKNITEAIKQHYMFCEKNFNDFINKRIGFEEFVEKEENSLRQSFTELLKGINVEEFGTDCKKSNPMQFGREQKIGYNQCAKEIKSQIEKLLK